MPVVSVAASNVVAGPVVMLFLSLLVLLATVLPPSGRLPLLLLPFMFLLLGVLLH